MKMHTQHTHLQGWPQWGAGKYVTMGSLKGKKKYLVAFASFHEIYTPTMAELNDLKLPP